MATSASRGGSQSMIHQDYIARIRFSNTLPPPPNPPKLLDIPNTGLSSGLYTAPGFASRLARDQPLNIEADAELGMPLDLVGMPGIFDGDESSIQAPLHAPVPHPHDRPLLRPLASLGKPKTADSGVSFLRRTEYISSHTSKSRFESTTSKTLIHNVGGRVTGKKQPTNVDKESPEYIKQQVEESFHIAALTLKDPSRTRHPTKRNVKLTESFPLIPDLNAFPDAGGYVSIKFQTNPVPPSNIYDIRLDSGVLRPLHPSDERTKAREEAIAAHQRDPERNPFPEHEQDYELFLVDTTKDTLNFKRKYDLMDPGRDNEDLYTHVNQDKTHCFRFKRIRAYETATTAGSQETKYDEEIVIAINDGRDGIHQRAAYYYPLVQRSTIRPQRKKNIDRQRWGFTDPEIDDPDSLDMLDITIRDPTEQEERERRVWIDSPYHQVDDPEEEDDEQDEREGGDTRAERQYQEDANTQLQNRGDEDLGSDS